MLSSPIVDVCATSYLVSMRVHVRIQNKERDESFKLELTDCSRVTTTRTTTTAATTTFVALLLIAVSVQRQNKTEQDKTFKLELTGTDCEGAKIGRVAKTIVTIINDEG